MLILPQYYLKSSSSVQIYTITSRIVIANCQLATTCIFPHHASGFEPHRNPHNGNRVERISPESRQETINKQKAKARPSFLPPAALVKGITLCARRQAIAFVETQMLRLGIASMWSQTSMCQQILHGRSLESRVKPRHPKRGPIDRLVLSYYVEGCDLSIFRCPVCCNCDN